MIKILFLRKVDVFFGLFIYSLFINIRVDKANMVECRIKRHQSSQGTIC